MIKFDLKSGYHHLEINITYQKYLGFAWRVDGIEKYFVFTVLPFGLSSAPYLFTKLMREIVRYWRSLAYPIVIYLDDGWCSLDLENCKKVSDLIKKDLKLAGFIVNNEKTVWEPRQKLEWLDFLWDLERGSIQIPVRKITRLKESIRSVLNYPQKVSARTLASIIGQIIAMSFAFGNVCQIMTRNLHVPIIDRYTWDGYIYLDPRAIHELHFWFNNCDTLPFRALSALHRPVERILFTDASNHAAAGILLQAKNEIVHVMFNEHEMKQSSTFRELKAVDFALKSLSFKLGSRYVKLYSDNQNVVRIINIGSMKMDLQEIALSIFHNCLKYNISLDVAWII